MDPLTKEERESFRQYAGASLEEPDGSECQWANHTLRLLDEADRLREENARLRQRVEELERDRAAVDEVLVEVRKQGSLREIDCANETLRAEAAEAKLANSEEGNRWLEAQIRDLEAKLARVVEELERRLARESKLLVECIKTRGDLGERMIAAEAKLAKVVTLLTNVEWSDNPWNAIKAARAAAQTKEEK